MPRLLIVDDDKRLVDSLLRRLKGHPVEVAAALDFSGAETEAERFQPHLAVLDWMLAGESGLDLIPIMKARGAGVVVCSGFAPPDIQREALKLGAVDYIEKPVSLGLVRAYLEQAYLDRQGRDKLLARASVTNASTLEYAKWIHIQNVLAAAGGHVDQAAKVLGVTRQGLQGMLKKAPPIK